MLHFFFFFEKLHTFFKKYEISYDYRMDIVDRSSNVCIPVFFYIRLYLFVRISCMPINYFRATSLIIHSKVGARRLDMNAFFPPVNYNVLHIIFPTM